MIDVSALVRDGSRAERERVAREIERACRDTGFFYVSGHGVPSSLLDRLDTAARRFFSLPPEVKAEISMERGGRAWRGFFPVGGELTSGRPDLKEGIYFGAEPAEPAEPTRSAEAPGSAKSLRSPEPPGSVKSPGSAGSPEPPGGDPRARLPLHGRNLFPAQVPELGEAVLEYLDRLTDLGQSVMRGVALSLGLAEDYFATGYTADPTVLFRIFHYPPAPPGADGWGVGEHTDYGLLTLLAQDRNGGLQVHAGSGWIEAPPIPGTFVCNIGDMLDRLTGGYYRSTPHRVRNVSGNERLSFPFFFDPAWDAEVPPLPSREAVGGGRARWDGQDLRAFTGTYGEYLLAKVSKVFPQLREDVL
ncbi:isopenicillin N synthase family dioxygenase [Streptosporangium sp. NPDC002721]|uniref:isopenicillin N synthase family dioxygenase n=1 Tax=Streptosporangium sp. NPDC002721 TaxID=3366188 RepID=UPI003676D053